MQDHAQHPGGHDHDGGGHEEHDHDHTPIVTTENERKVLIALVITGSFMVVEVIGGYLSNSLALLADAGHMLTDTAALALSFFAFRIGRRAADGRRTFGYLRFEVIAAFINALALFAIVLWVAFEAWHRFSAPPEILAGPMMIVAVLGLLVNILVLRILQSGEHDHVNIQAASLHVLGDLLGSVGAIGAAVVIWLTGWTPIDPILSLVVSLLILRSAWFLAKRSLNILLEGAPEKLHPEALRSHILAGFASEVIEVDHIHIWQITDKRVLATLHVRPKELAPARDLGNRIAASLHETFAIEHATVALDWSGDGQSCSLTATSQRMEGRSA
ncbi:cation diffusion facilitator family transporter [Paracoccus aminophilus]|uniref:Co/Zn/Cd efflux system component n=1 Tax=Paracoccus aminophilus JCM 7686 TaxID=1367847 RepID=S5Y0S3_PARAH|nr:cation diffusion facilitator family transporter [Paracoccus aminophilus]AGT11092.1 Co/Zn/Cd efflux system component [Paracoccus aminophilus JCM 7686]